MSLLLVHLSDAHFRSPDVVGVNRLLALKQAVLAKVPHAEMCLLLFSGDVANTGAPEEYAAAMQFIEQLSNSLRDAGIAIVETVAVPGNHDLNLDRESETRRYILDSPEHYLKDKIDFGGSNFQAIISVQDDFFQFESSASRQPPLLNQDKLYYRRSYSVGDHSVLVHCFNTAWLSRRREIQSKLYIPEQVLSYETPPHVSLSLAMFHHPYNWLNADNKRRLQEFVEVQADIVLTGHEHNGSADRHLSTTGGGLDYIQAPAFYDPSVADNGFRLLFVDFAEKAQVVSTFAWAQNRFTEISSAKWTLHRNARRMEDPFDLREDFVSKLRDVGTGFRHPRCVPPTCHLRLRDLYVYPDLTRHNLDKVHKQDGGTTRFSGADLMDLVQKSPHLLLLGPDDCGKTSLARIFFEDATKNSYLPLLVSGDQLRGLRDEAGLIKALSRIVSEEYSASSTEPYFQADLNRRVLIVDDLDKAKLSKQAGAIIFPLLKHRFGKIVALASDVFQFHEIALSGDSGSLGSFERCTIKEFGRYHRQKLIRAWVSIGLDNYEEPDKLETLVVTLDKTISTVLGKNVLPHHPVTILTMLQILEGSNTTNTANGAYGYLYEVLLKSALAKVNPHEVDEKITYISGIGYKMFRAKQPTLSEEELREVHAEYCDRYDMVRDFAQMTADLIRAEVLVESRKTYRFKYPYELYYATAKYYQDHAQGLRQELYAIADYIYGDANANVLIFYVYLTKDEDLIRHLVSNAKHIYQNHKLCGLEEDVSSLNVLSTTKPLPLELEIGNTSDSRDEHNRRQDKADEEVPAIEPLDFDVRYDDSLQDAVKLTIAFKTLQILGQVLRNFTGSLEGNLKLDITRECYALGMRSLSAILGLVVSDIDGMRQYLGTLIALRSGITDKQELADKADNAIVWLARASTFGTIKRISYAVGHSNLTNTYRKVLDESTDLSTQMIDAAIKLDHFERVPEQELERIQDRVKNNNFAFMVVRDLVVDYLYLYNVDFPMMQKLGAKWSISVSKSKFLINRSKR